jgi:hypothetical protein
MRGVVSAREGRIGQDDHEGAVSYRNNDPNPLVAIYLLSMALALFLWLATPGCLATTHPAPLPTPVAVPAPPPPAPPSLLPLHNEGGHFADSNGQRWYWKGATDFLLLKKFLDGEDIQPLLQQRKDAGANLVRVFGMCANLAHFYPQEYDDYWGGLVAFVDRLYVNGLYVELTVFADAQMVLPDLTTQIAHWQGFSRVASKPNVFLELVNENSHAGNTIRVERFTHLDGPAMQAHGSEQTDQHPIEPHWNYVVYHARREGPPDARGATNYDPYEFEARYPKDRPWIADEGIKTTDAGFAYLMGIHARVSDGGTWHSQAGVTSQMWSDAEFEAAKAFYRGIGQ